MTSKKLRKFLEGRKRLLKPVKIHGTKTIYHREEGRLVAEVKETTIDVPVKGGPFPKRILGLCKTCPKIYCNGWDVEQTEFFIFWHCEKYTVQEKKKWSFILE